MSSSTSSSKWLPKPRKVITYPLPDDPTGGAIFLYGQPSATHIAVFCAGFPDDHENGQSFCFRLAEESDTLIGLMCLPGYDDRTDKPWTSHKRNGYSFDDMANAVREVVKILRQESTQEKAKLIGIFHDWGVVAGMIWTNRCLGEDVNSDCPDELILFDVLGPVHKEHKNDLPSHRKKTMYELFVEVYYKVVYAIAFALQCYFSKYLGLLCFVLGSFPMTLFGFAPTLSIDSNAYENRVSPLNVFRLIYMAYPYYNMFKIMFTGEWRRFISLISLPKDFINTPVLYLYGKEKRVMFHSDSAVKYLQREANENRSKSNAIAIESAGHWLYLQKPDDCIDLVKAFITN